MDEREWLLGRDPEAMLAAVRERMTERKWVLLYCAVARRMEWNGWPESAFIDRHELNPVAPASGVATRTLFGASVEWTEEEEPPPLRRRPGNDVGECYRREARRHTNRYRQAMHDRIAIRTEFLSHFPMFMSFEAWDHCRAALSTALYADTWSELSLAAERRVLGFIPKKARSTESIVNRAEAEKKVREVRKQLVHDMNAAMRGYAKPARELLGHFLHEQLGNPFRPYRFDAEWRTPDVTGLARGIFEGAAFDRCNALADALMEAGCDDAPMLLHLQEEREHQRGCWALDLILGLDAELYAREPLLESPGTDGRHEPLGLAEPRNYDV